MKTYEVRLICSCLLSLVNAVTISGQDADLVRTFGTARSEPVDAGFYFRTGTYVEAPYIVERRGLDIYIDGHLISKGPEWPPYDYRVDEDPGDPPDGSSPFDSRDKHGDPRDSFWAKKWRYLMAHYAHEKAKRIMLETYLKCPEVKEVNWHEVDPDVAIVVGVSGARKNLSLRSMSMFSRAPITEKEMLERREKKREFYAKMLSSPVALFDVVSRGGAELYIPESKVIQAIKALVSEKTYKQKVSALASLGIMHPKSHVLQRIVKEFRGSPQLEERIAELEETKQIQRRSADFVGSAKHAAQAIADYEVVNLRGNEATSIANARQEAKAERRSFSPQATGPEQESLDFFGKMGRWIDDHKIALGGIVAAFCTTLACIVIARRSFVRK